MWHHRHPQTSCLGQLRAAAWTVFALALLAGWSSPASAKPFPPDPIAQLREALKEPIPPDASDDKAVLKAALQKRKASLDERIASLHNLGEMSRALLLLEWHLDDPDELVRQNEQDVWNALADRFTNSVRATLKSKDEAQEIAAANLLAETAVAARAFPSQTLLARRKLAAFAPELVTIIESPDRRSPETRVAAVRALSRINPIADSRKTLETSVRGLGYVLKNGDVTERRAAARALGELVRVLTTSTERASQESIPAIAVATIPVVVRGLGDADADVRRLSVEAIDLPVVAIADRTLGEDVRPEMVQLAQVLRDAASSGSDKGARLGQTVNDADPAVRLAARHALEDIGYFRQRMLPGVKRPYLPPDLGSPDKVHHTPYESPFTVRSSEPRKPARKPEAVHDVLAQDNQKPTDLLLEGLKRTILDLAAGLADPNPRSRLAAVEALEMLGDEARPVAPAIVRSLEDPDKFVRWAAARTLGRIGEKAPAGGDSAIAALSRLLFDADLSLQLAAATALGHYGPSARGAVEALGRRSLDGDAEIRIGAMHALESIGTDSAPALPQIATNLCADIPMVRRTAADVLGRFGSLAQASIPALRQALTDPDGDVRRAASDALLAIASASRPR